MQHVTVLIRIFQAIILWDISDAWPFVNFNNAPFVAVAPAAAVGPVVAAPSFPGYISNTISGGGGGRVCFGGQCFTLNPPSSSSPAGLICNSGACIPSTTRFNNPSGSNYTYTGPSTNNLYCVTNSLCYVYNSNNYNSGGNSGIISNVNFGSSAYTFTTSSCNSGITVGTVTATNAVSYDIGSGPFSISNTGQITTNQALTSGQTYSTTVTGYDSTLYGTGTASLSVTANCASATSNTCIFNGVLCYTTTNG